jgi:hypothetical protein
LREASEAENPAAHWGEPGGGHPGANKPLHQTGDISFSDDYGSPAAGAGELGRSAAEQKGVTLFR